MMITEIEEMLLNSKYFVTGKIKAEDGKSYEFPIIDIRVTMHNADLLEQNIQSLINFFTPLTKQEKYKYQSTKLETCHVNGAVWDENGYIIKRLAPAHVYETIVYIYKNTLKDIRYHKMFIQQMNLEINSILQEKR